MGSQRRLEPGGSQVPRTLFLHHSSGFLGRTGMSYRSWKSHNLNKKDPVSLPFPIGPAEILTQAPGGVGRILGHKACLADLGYGVPRLRGRAKYRQPLFSACQAAFSQGINRAFLPPFLAAAGARVLPVAASQPVSGEPVLPQKLADELQGPEDRGER